VKEDRKDWDRRCSEPKGFYTVLRDWLPGHRPVLQECQRHTNIMENKQELCAVQGWRKKHTHTHARDCAEGLVNRPSALNQTPA